MPDAPDTLERRDYSQAERDQMDESDFAGPHESFPIKTQADVDNAARLIGHAADPAAVKARIKAIAKRKGFSLPQAWQDEDDSSQERSMSTTISPLERATPANHEPMTGTHSHAHPAFGSQGDDATHSHEHRHEHDADHGHSHSQSPAGRDETPPERAVPTALTPESLSVYLPITRVDAASRMVTGQATVEQPDSYGTIFGYYPEAWTSWRGNMREQHDPKKAVGKAVSVIPDPVERAIYVDSKVSRGAQDTWLKLEDGVLSGYSASVIPDPEFGPDPKKWPTKEYHGKRYPYLPRYRVAELSYVDNPSTPGCNITLVRADGLLTEVIDTNEEETPPVVVAPAPPLERAGKRISAETRAGNHKAIAGILHGAVALMQNCGPDCAGCLAAQKAIDPDGDGDIDLGGYDDPDGDSADLYGTSGDADMSRALEGLIERSLEKVLAPVFARFSGIAGSLARAHGGTPNMESLIEGVFTRALAGLDLPSAASLSEVRSDLSEVKATVARIDATPVPGAPVMHAASLPLPVEKHLPTDPYQRPRSSGSAVYDAVAHLSRGGYLDTTEKQVDALAAALAAQRRG